MRSPKSRTYRMDRRAQLVDETRLRITEAAVRLHTTIGPSRTTIAGVAGAAGVTRLTVYRHFPDLETLFAACTAHWMTLHPAPDPSAWRPLNGLAARARRALDEIYAWHREVGAELEVTQRDPAALPVRVVGGIRQRQEAIVDGLLAGDLPDGQPGRRLRAVAALVTSLPAYRSLTGPGGLSDTEAVEVAVALLLAAEAGSANG